MVSTGKGCSQGRPVQGRGGVRDGQCKEGVESGVASAMKGCNQRQPVQGRGVVGDGQ